MSSWNISTQIVIRFACKALPKELLTEQCKQISITSEIGIVLWNSLYRSREIYILCKSFSGLTIIFYTLVRGMFIFNSRVVLGTPTNIMINIGIINKKMENHTLVNIETLLEKTGALISFQLWFLLQTTEGKISKQICGTMTNIFLGSRKP